MSPLTSGVHGRPLCRRQIADRLKPNGMSVKPEIMNVWRRAKSLGPHARSSSPKLPTSFGPNAPTRGFAKPPPAVQHEYDELSYERVYVYEPRRLALSPRR